MISRSRSYIYCSTSMQPSRTCVWRLVLLRLARARTKVRRSGGIRLQAGLRALVEPAGRPVASAGRLGPLLPHGLCSPSGPLFFWQTMSFNTFDGFLQCVLAAAGGPCHCTAAFAVQSRPCPAAARPATQMQFSWPRPRELLHTKIIQSCRRPAPRLQFSFPRPRELLHL